MTKQIVLYFLATLTLISCKQQIGTAQAQDDAFKIEELKSIIVQRGKTWSQGLKKKDAQLFADLYDQDAHYLPDGGAAIHGKENIVNYWKASMAFLTDIQLNMETLEGTKELLYETGSGIALVLNQMGGNDTIHYKYVNVWKLQKDGTYKVVIDTYNDIKNE